MTPKLREGVQSFGPTLDLPVNQKFEIVGKVEFSDPNRKTDGRKNFRPVLLAHTHILTLSYIHTVYDTMLRRTHTVTTLYTCYTKLLLNLVKFLSCSKEEYCVEWRVFENCLYKSRICNPATGSPRQPTKPYSSHKTEGCIPFVFNSFKFLCSSRGKGGILTSTFTRGLLKYFGCPTGSRVS